MKKSDTISTEHKNLQLSIGKKLKQLRAETNKTYVNTAKEMGVPKHTLNRMELGQINFQFLTLVQILDYYQISLSKFFEELE